MKNFHHPNTVSGLIVPLAILLGWHMLAWRASTPFFPGPWQVCVAISMHWQVIADQLGHTLARAAIGFLIAAVLMIPLGILLGRLKTLGQIVEPVMDMLATLPPPAIVPLVMLFVGTGDAAKISVIAYAAAVPLLMNGYEASKILSPMANQVARSLRLSRFETMLHIDLPASMPMIATGVRLAVASALLVSVTAEMLLSTNGIGVFIQKQQENFQIASGLAAIAFISVVGLIINNLVFQFEKWWLFWHYRGSENYSRV